MNKQFEKLSRISDDEVIAVIKEIEREIRIYQNEMDILYKDLQRNKVAIYMNKGRIEQRRNFINKLKSLLK